MSIESTARRGIDHLVLAVKDLTKARKTYEALGFTLTPDAQHPFGTGNFLAQFPGTFLEVLAVTRPKLVKKAKEGHFSFAAYNRDFLKRREGFSMLVFESQDARRDRDEFAAEGLTTYAPFDFERKATLPDGKSVTVGFSLAFVTESRAPDCVFFTCQQHAPEYFWKPAYQVHPNGAERVDEVVMVAEEPRELEQLFVGLQGRERVAAYSDRLLVETARGRVLVQRPGAFEARFPGMTPPDAPATPHFAGYVIGVEDLNKTAKLLKKNGVGAVKVGRMLQVPPQQAFGCMIAFQEPTDA
ncbi:MAG: VOC family protein [Limibacillus sp.]|jgi:catechol 2,3-dioxygenase-like lactoylglutathione lyase family enzyme